MNSKLLIETIRKIVRQEIKKIMIPIIRESVGTEVNAVLAEKFVSTLAGKSIVSEEIVAKKPAKVEEKKLIESRKKELLKKMGADENPMLGFLYEDIEERPSGNGMPTQLPDGRVVDSDDDGIDLSRFGMS